MTTDRDTTNDDGFPGVISGADLNLIKPLAALLQERNVSRAAALLHVSQPAMSRTLQRLRRVFRDDILVGRAGGYELTPAGRRLRLHLTALLPEIAAMYHRDAFEPARAAETFRVAGTEYAETVLAERLARKVLRLSPLSCLQYEAWHRGVFDDLDRGRIDLAFCGVHPPSPLRSERLVAERFLCVMSCDHPLAGRAVLDLGEYLDASHVVVTVARGEQEIVDADLGRQGRRRRTGLVVPSHRMAMEMLPGTDLLATVPERLVPLGDGLHAVSAPVGIGAVTYAMVWHPRLDGDPAQQWLRRLVRAAVPADTAVSEDRVQRTVSASVASLAKLPPATVPPPKV